MQASSWREQEFLAAIPGFVPFVVSEVRNPTQYSPNPPPNCHHPHPILTQFSPNPQNPNQILTQLCQQLLSSTPCENTHKVFCDLTAELVKFNPPLLERLSHSIAEACDGDGAARFTEMVAGNIVNSSVLVHCISLTSSGLCVFIT